MEVAGNIEKIFITRDKFDEITSTLLDETLKKTEEVIEVARKKGYGKIDEILLVGGSTRMLQVKKALTEKFSESKIKILEPDKAVVKGAAIHALNIYVNSQKSFAENDFQLDEEVKVNSDEKELNAKDYREDLTISPRIGKC